MCTSTTETTKLTWMAHFVNSTRGQWQRETPYKAEHMYIKRYHNENPCIWRIATIENIHNWWYGTVIHVIRTGSGRLSRAEIATLLKWMGNQERLWHRPEKLEIITSRKNISDVFEAGNYTFDVCTNHLATVNALQCVTGWKCISRETVFQAQIQAAVYFFCCFFFNATPSDICATFSILQCWLMYWCFASLFHRHIISLNIASLTQAMFKISRHTCVVSVFD